MKQDKSPYPLADRIALVNLYLTSDRTLREIAAEAGISYQTLNNWVQRQINRGKMRSKDMKGKQSSPKKSTVDPRDAEIIRLKKELEQAKMMAHAYDTMIRIAETELNISIRKKAGAKQ
jgi:transposase-like protein